MKRVSVLILLVFALGCSSTKNSGSGAVTSMLGTWSVTGNLGSQGGPGTYQVALVSSPCSVTTPVGSVLSARTGLLHRQQQHWAGFYLRNRTTEHVEKYGARSLDRRGRQPGSR